MKKKLKKLLKEHTILRCFDLADTDITLRSYWIILEMESMGNEDFLLTLLDVEGASSLEEALGLKSVGVQLMLASRLFSNYEVHICGDDQF